MGAYKSVDATFTTKLSVKACADAFKASAPDQIGRLTPGSRFFQPEEEVTPFSALETREQATFMVGWNSTKGHSVIMAVYEREYHRDVRIESSYLGLAMRIRAKKTLDRLARAVTSPAAGSTQPGRAAAPEGISAGWNLDPYEVFELRYWNGAKWTEHVSTGGVQAVDHR